MRKVIVSLGAFLLLLSGGCMSAYSQRQVALRTDSEVCSRYGVDARSAVYLECRALQEQRRQAATDRQNGLIAQGTDVIVGRTD